MKISKGAQFCICFNPKIKQKVVMGSQSPGIRNFMKQKKNPSRFLSFFLMKLAKGLNFASVLIPDKTEGRHG